jgi:hypothetical protein
MTHKNNFIVIDDIRFEIGLPTKEQTDIFISKAFEYLIKQCPLCKEYIQIPHMINQSDYDHIQKIIKYAEKYLAENIPIEKMLIELLQKLKEEKTIQ